MAKTSAIQRNLKELKCLKNTRTEEKNLEL